VGGADEVGRGRPMAAEHEDGVVLGGIERLLSQPHQSGGEGEVMTAVGSDPLRLGEHDYGECETRPAPAISPMSGSPFWYGFYSR